MINSPVTHCCIIIDESYRSLILVGLSLNKVGVEEMQQDRGKAGTLVEGLLGPQKNTVQER